MQRASVKRCPEEGAALVWARAGGGGGGGSHRLGPEAVTLQSWTEPFLGYDFNGLFTEA